MSKKILVTATWVSQHEMEVPDDWTWDGSLGAIVDVEDFTSANAELVDYDVRPVLDWSPS